MNESDQLLAIPKINPNNFFNYFTTAIQQLGAPVSFLVNKLEGLVLDTYYLNDTEYSKLVVLTLYMRKVAQTDVAALDGSLYIEVHISDDDQGANDRQVAIASLDTHNIATTEAGPNAYLGNVVPIPFVVPAGKYFKLTGTAAGGNDEFEIWWAYEYIFFTNIKYKIDVSVVGGNCQIDVNGDQVEVPFSEVFPTQSNVLIEAFPDGGYHVSELKLDGVIQPLADFIYLEDITASHAVEFTIAAD
jgi:hypothetical protein